MNDQATLPRLGLVGAGRWGRNLIRNFVQLGVLQIVCDHHPERLASIQQDFPQLKVTTDFSELLRDPELAAVIIATPARTHEALAEQSLRAGKHIYVEKPLARSPAGATRLSALAAELQLTLMVGHLLLYHPAVNRLRSLISAGELGEIRYVNSDRRNYPLERNDNSVLWDLAPHDLSMVAYLLDTDQFEVLQARGFCTQQDEVVDVAHLDLRLGRRGVAVHIHNSWIDPHKQCLLTVNGTEQTAVLNDGQPDEKLKLYRLNAETGELEVRSVSYSDAEPLRLECQHFVHCLMHNVRPRSDGIAGYQVVQMLARAAEVMQLS